jgi:pimeloyl-ACP methyl ester carboxylesterase
MTNEFADVNGIRVHYQIAGNGQSLILIHAGIAHLDMWDDQMDDFTQHYQVIRYDVRGEGKTPSPPGLYSDCEDLHGLLNHLGLERITFLGASLGGRIALDFALEYPERVEALILVAPGLEGYEYTHIDEATLQQDAAIEAAYEKGELDLAAELETQLWVDGSGRTPEQVNPTVRERALAMNRHNLGLPKAHGLRQHLEPPAISRLAEIKTPTLIIVGDRDLPDMLAIADILAERVAGAHKVIMPETAHLPNMERPAEFNQIVLGFLEKLSKH